MGGLPGTFAENSLNLERNAMLKSKKYPSGMVELAGMLGESGAQFGANIRPMDTGEFSLSVSWGNEACYFHAFPRQKTIASAKKAAENLYAALIAHLVNGGNFPRREQILPNHYPSAA